MNTYQTIIIIAVIVVLLILTGLIWRRIRRRKKPAKISLYQEALHLYLDGKLDAALEKLKKTVKADTENIMAYIKLGDIFREKGLPIRAARVHRNLLVRSDLNEEEINTTLYHLIQDYQDAEMLDRAVEMAERLNHRTHKNADHQKLLLSLYETKGDWDKAFFARQNLNRWQKKHDQHILALYKVQSGLEQIKKGVEREGRIRFREALKLDKQCIPAYLYWGDSYRREQRNEDAFRVWNDFTKKVPEWAHLAFSRLEQVLYDLGKYGDMESIYQQVSQQKPKNPAAMIHLVDLLQKQGRLNEAQEACETILEKHPDLTECRAMLVKILRQKGETIRALDDAIHVLEKRLETRSVCQCAQCGHQNKEPLWYCPQCHQWDTYLT